MAAKRASPDTPGADQIRQTPEYAAIAVSEQSHIIRKYPVGAEVLDGRIDFRIWAPGREKGELIIEAPEPQVVAMLPQGDYFSTVVGDPGTTVLYRFRLEGRDELLPDPASRFQPRGPRGPSEVIDPAGFAWTDRYICEWDDLHHSIRVALTGRSEAYYSDFRGLPQEFVSVVRHGFLYQGQHSRWQNKPRGTPSRGIEHARLICYIENHDQVANSARGSRLGQLTSPGRHRAATTLLLLGPWTPLIFQGQEFAASTPFVFFADHDPAAAATVAEGRKKFLSQFPSLAVPAMQDVVAEPSRIETFLRSKLDLRQRIENVAFCRMFRTLTRLRTTDEMFFQHGNEGIDGAVLSDRAFMLRFFGPASDRLVIVNFGADLLFAPCPEPLLAPLPGCHWRVLFCSEEPRFGGSGAPALELDQGWRIPAESAVALACESYETSPPPPASCAEPAQEE